MDERAHRAYVTLLIDLSSAPQQDLAEWEAATRAVIDKLLKQDAVPNVWLGIDLFDGSDSPRSWGMVPTRDAAKLESHMDEFFSTADLDTSATNLNGAVSQSLANLRDYQKAAIEYSGGGMATTGYLVVLSAGPDTAGSVDAQTVADDVAAARTYGDQADEAPTVQTMALALQPGDYDTSGLAELLGDEQWVSESSADGLTGGFEAVADRIVARVDGTYLLAYCSPSRDGEHSASVAVDGRDSNQATVGFSADGFGPGCDDSFLASGCSRENACGGYYCGCCNDNTEVCSSAVNGTCTNYCDTQILCPGAPMKHPLGSVQICELNCPGSQWSRVYGNGSYQVSNQLVAMGPGQLFMAGDSGEAMDFGGDTLSGSGNFVASFFGDGSHAWSKHLEASHMLTVRAAAAGDSSDVIVGGDLGGTADLGGGTIGQESQSGIFVARFGSTGSHVWGKSFQGDATSSIINISDLDVDGSGNIVFVGSFDGEIDFGGGPISSAGMSDIFVVSLDAAGNHRWTSHYGGPDMDEPRQVAVSEAGDVVLTGLATNSEIVVDGGSTKVSNSFMLSLDKDGNYRWSKDLTPGLSVRTNHTLAATNFGRVILAGDFQDPIDLGGGQLTAAGELDVVLASFDSMGEHLWSKSLGGAGTESAKAVAVDRWGNIALGGEFMGSASFGGSTFQSAGGTNTNDAFVAVFTRAGEHRWSTSFGGDQHENLTGVVFDPAGGILVTGMFFDSFDFAGDTLTSAGLQDIYLIRFGSQ